MAAAALLALALTMPVDGTVARRFELGPDPYAGGQHRGVDLAAPPGARVRAACGGRVVVAGRVAGAPLVTLRCGRWRVTHMPLATIAVRPGARVRRGALVGTVARSSEHSGLHLGVRRDGERFGYVDPLRFVSRGSPPPPVAARPHESGRRAPPPSRVPAGRDVPA